MNKLYLEWDEARRMLDKYKILERKLRERIIEEHPGDQGTTKYDEDGCCIKIIRRVTRSVDPVELAVIWERLTDQEKACISYVPQLDAKRFDKLPERNKLSRVVTIKPSLPTVELEIFDGPEVTDD